jgi:hypothetical protein
MLQGARVDVPFDKPEVNQMNQVCFLACADRDVFRLDISMQISLIVHKLNSVDALESDHDDCLFAKLSVAKFKQLHQVWAQQRHHQAVVLVLGAVPVQLRKPNAALQVLAQDGLKL